MVLSAFFFGCANLALGYVNHLPTFQLVFFRAIGTVICCIFILAKKQINPIGNHPKWLILRSLVGITSLVLFYKALQLMPIASAVSLRYLSPFFASLLAVLLLKERMKWLQWIFLLSAFIGVIMLKDFDNRIPLFGLLIALTSSVFSGGVYVIIRKIGSSEHPIVIINYFMTTALVIGGTFTLFDWVTPKDWEWAALLIIGLLGFGGQLYMTKALQMAEANLVTPFKYSEVIFTITLGWVFLGEYQTTWTILAMTIIILSILGNVWAKRTN